MELTRLEVLQKRADLAAKKGRKFDARAEMHLPDLDGAEYLLEAMFALGPTRSTGMSEAPTGFAEIEAFAAVSGRVDEAWEKEALHAMCVAYVDARSTGDHPLAREPVDVVNSSP